jgi:positive regulator of sigma E activity
MSCFLICSLSIFAAYFYLMKQEGHIEHQGIVSKIENGKVYVNLLNVSNCSSCHVQSMCQVSDVDRKEIEITNEQDRRFKQGDKVEVSFDKSLGPKALLLGYLLPFIFVLVTLLIAYQITGDEVVSGLASLLILVPYYLLLYSFRSKLKKEFVFKIKASKNI